MKLAREFRDNSLKILQAFESQGELSQNVCTSNHVRAVLLILYRQANTHVTVHGKKVPYKNGLPASKFLELEPAPSVLKFVRALKEISEHMGLQQNDPELYEQMNKLMMNIAFMRSFYKKFKSTWDSLDLHFENKEYRDWLFKLGWVIFLLSKIVLIYR